MRIQLEVGICNPVCTPGRGPHQNLTMLSLWSWTCLQNLRNTFLLFIIHTICGTVLWQPEITDTGALNVISPERTSCPLSSLAILKTGRGVIPTHCRNLSWHFPFQLKSCDFKLENCHFRLILHLPVVFFFSLCSNLENVLLPGTYFLVSHWSILKDRWEHYFYSNWYLRSILGNL